MCRKLRLSHIEIWANPSQDPYKAGVNLNKSGCSGYGLLTFFSNYWNQKKKTIQRDAAHLFSGKGLECRSNGCVIGCASTRALCNSRAYGVNYIAYSGDSKLRANLFAHELGHNSGYGHDAVTSKYEYIMEPYNNDGDSGWSSRSSNAIKGYTDSLSCIATTGGNCWGDGTLCGIGTTCNYCLNTYRYWYSKAMTACGKEPCWGRGTICGAGTSCNACCKSYSWWWSKFFTACN